MGLDVVFSKLQSVLSWLLKVGFFFVMKDNFFRYAFMAMCTMRIHCMYRVIMLTTKGFVQSRF